MLLFLSFFKKKKEQSKTTTTTKSTKNSNTTPGGKKTNEEVSKRKGEIGEYKIDIQLDQMPKEYRNISDIMIKNPKAKSGYSQIDHIVITPYGVFVIETKNYKGTIYGGKGRKTWLVNGKFKMMNPFVQNYGHMEALKSLIDKKYHSLFISMVSFTKRCTFKVEMDYRKIASDELIVYDIELSEFIHRKVSILKFHHKEPLLSEADILTLYDIFSEANISDPKIRETHVQTLMTQKTLEASERQPQCVICNKVVSDRVMSFCLHNKKFKGKIYCYEHQNGI